MTQQLLSAPLTPECVLYVRTGTANGPDDTFEALERQRTTCRARAKALGYSVVEVFTDVAVDETATNRDGLNSLRAFVRRRRQSRTVFVWDLRRLSRDIDSLAVLLGTLRMEGITVVSANQNEQERLMPGVLKAIDQFLFEIRSAAVKEGLRRAKERRRAA